MIEGPMTGIWGWPWHGLATGGAIPPSGKTITQPPHCHSWLIDIGLPAIALTSAEDANATANDYEWRNYALISAGQIYDTALPAESFIHVDSDDKCWLVSLAYSVPSANTLRITATIKRFGLFGYGELGTVTKTVDVACDHIELTKAAGNPIQNYDYRDITLHDVWTNGGKALIGIMLTFLTLPSTETSDLFSVVEITISGAGGSTGSGLTLAGSEVIGQDALTFKSDSGNVAPPANPFCNGLNWVASGTYQYYLPYSRTISATYAKEALYSDAGAAQALAFMYETSTGQTTCEDAWQQDSATETCYIWATGQTVPTVETHLVAKITGFNKIAIVKNGIVTDHLTLTSTYYMHEWYTLCDGAFSSGLFIDNDYITPTSIYTGGLSENFDVNDSLDINAISELLTGWRNDEINNTTTLNTLKVIGVQNIDAKSAAFYLDGSTRTYGQVATPLGNKTLSLTPTANIFFAWQRKTGDFAFSTSPICYV